jgi:hypothetical protein
MLDSFMRVNWSINFDAAVAVARGEAPQGSLRATLASGTVADDVLWPTTLVPPLVHLRVVEALREAGLTGWAARPATYTDFPTDDAWFALAVTGRCGPLKVPQNSDREDAVLAEYVGLEPDLGNWDGSDFFMGRDATLWTFVTEDARTLIERVGTRNLAFDDPAEVTVSYLSE